MNRNIEVKNKIIECIDLILLLKTFGLGVLKKVLGCIIFILLPLLENHRMEENKKVKGQKFDQEKMGLKEIDYMENLHP